MADRVKGISVVIDGDTTKLSKALNDVNKNIKSTQSQLKDVNNLLKMDPGNTELLKQKQEALNSAIKETKEKLKMEEEAMNQLKNADPTAENLEHQKALAREIEATKQSLKSLKDEANGFGSSFSIALKSASESVHSLGEKMKEVGGKITDIGKKMSGVSMAAAGLGTAAIKIAADFDSSMSNVQALSGATADEFEQLKDKAQEMGKSTKFSASESADAFGYMALAGWKTQDMLVGIEPVLNLAAAANMDLAEASDIVTDYLTAFGLEAKDAAKFSDQMAYAMSNSNTDVTMLGEAYKNCAATAHSLGYSVEDTTAVIMTMANAGIKGGEAGTGLSSIMTRLATDTKGCAKALEQYGVHVYDNEGNMKSLSSILEGMSNIWGELTDQEQASLAKTIAGTNQYSKFQTIMAGLSEAAKENGQSFTDYADALSKCDGVAGEMADVMQNNLNGELTKLKSATEGLAITFGEILIPYVTKGVQFLQGLIDKLDSLDEGQKKAIIIIGTIVAAIGPLLIIIGQIISSVGSILNAVSFLISPMGLVVVAIAAVVAAGVLLYKNWDTITAKAKELKDAIAGKFKDIADKVVEAWDSIKTKTKEIWDGVTSCISDTFGSIVNKAASFGTSLKTKISGDLSNIKSIYENHGGGVTGVVAVMWEGLENQFSQGFDIVNKLTGGKLTGIKTVFDNAWSSIITKTSSSLLNWKNKISTQMSNAFSVMSNAVSRLKSLFNFSWSLPKIKLPHFSISGSFSLDPPSIPHISVSWYRKAMDGGMILNSPTIIGMKGNTLLAGGEAGSETVVGTGSLLNMIRSAVTESGGAPSIGEVNITVYGAPGQSVEELADIIEDRINRKVLIRGAAFA